MYSSNISSKQRAQEGQDSLPSPPEGARDMVTTTSETAPHSTASNCLNQAFPLLGGICYYLKLQGLVMLFCV